MKNLLLVFLMLVCSVANGQILKDTDLNLNSGGAIYDVAYDSYYDAYIVVGDFSSVDGQARNNLAFIDANTFDLLPQAPISSIDGIIRSVEVVNNISTYNAILGAGHRNFIYLGGDFKTINTHTRIHIVQILATHYYSNPPAGGLANYNVSPWDAEFYDYTTHGVNDLLIYGDTLMVVGDFYAVTPSYYPSDNLSSVLTFKANQIGLQNFSAFAQPSGYQDYNLAQYTEQKSSIT